MRRADGSRYPIFFSQDGEATVMEAAFDEEVEALFNEAGVTVAKKPPSQSSKTQEWDKCTNFRDAKRELGEGILSSSSQYTLIIFSHTLTFVS